MSFSHRPRERLFDRLRGRVGSDFFDEVKSAFEEDPHNMFFDIHPQQSTAPFRRGFPFDEEPRRRSFRSFFEEPLHEPPWTDDLRRKRGPASPSSDQPSTSQPREETAEELPTDLNQHGLRNTVPFAENNRSSATDDEERQHRSMSAPPDGTRSPRRFVTKCEIPPTVGDPEAQKPASNVRVIPIQVEGRSEPVVNTKLASNMDSATHFADPAPPAGSFEGRLPRDFGNYQNHSPRFQRHEPKAKKQERREKTPPAAPTATTTQPPPAAPSPTPPPPPPPILDPLAKVAKVQAEVEELAKQVEAANPTSRKDKQYLYLDEMLTRELIKLDDIETEGKEEVRNARKNAIRSIQRCISTLESKVPAEQMEVEEGEKDVEMKQEKEEEGKDVEMKQEDNKVEEKKVESEGKQEVEQKKDIEMKEEGGESEQKKKDESVISEQ